MQKCPRESAKPNWRGEVYRTPVFFVGFLTTGQQHTSAVRPPGGTRRKNPVSLSQGDGYSLISPHCITPPPHCLKWLTFGRGNRGSMFPRQNVWYLRGWNLLQTEKKLCRQRNERNLMWVRWFWEMVRSASYLKSVLLLGIVGTLTKAFKTDEPIDYLFKGKELWLKSCSPWEMWWSC